jgi:hypothetical protein
VREIEQSLAQTYRRLTYASAVLMALGWVWHVLRGDADELADYAGAGIAAADAADCVGALGMAGEAAGSAGVALQYHRPDCCSRWQC